MISSKRAKQILKAARGKKVLVAGDLMLDRYVYGTVSRISPEAPVPVVLVTGDRVSPGGAANVALNIQALGGQAVVAGVVGKDAAGRELIEVLSSAGICTDGIVACDGARTTVKTRVVAERQQVVRVDREDQPERTAGVLKEVCRRISGLARGVGGLLIEDYGKGVVSQQTVAAVLAAARRSRIPAGYDPKENHQLKVAGIALATPNYMEACKLAGLKEPALRRKPESDETLAEAGRILKRKWNPDLLIITLGPDGMYLLPRGKKPRVIPTRAREVFDVSGAGDTVIGAAMLFMVAGASHYEAASLANYAAGVVVGKLGTATCSPDEMLASIG